jgi:MurNAc alpha-1-phosphate uridylyltransferase
MILAAGFGTRMGDLTRTRPKPLIAVNGQPLLAHALAAAGNANPVVVNGHYRADMICDYLMHHHPDHGFSLEHPDILDSGGAIKQALPMLGHDPVLTLNADAVWAGPVAHDILTAHWDGTQMDALLLLVPHARTVARHGGGDFALSPQGHITWDKTTNGLVYTGAQIINTTRIAAQQKTVFSLRDIWQDMIHERRCFGCIYPGFWADVGHPDGIAQAEEMIKTHAV